MKFLKASFATLLALAVISLIQTPVGYAAGSCTMENGPSSELTEYFTKLDEALTKLKDAGASGSCGGSGNGQSAIRDLSEAAASITRGTNRALTQDCYVSAASFTTELSLKSEVPPALRQHLNTLIKKSEDINLAIDQVYRTCSQNTEVQSSSIIPGYTEPATERLGKLWEDILQNHTSIVCAYRNVALGRPPLEAKFYLTQPNFLEKLGSTYGPSAQETCRKEGDVFKQVKEAIDKLAKTAGNIKRGMSVWQTSDKKTESPHEVEMRDQKEKEMAPKIQEQGFLSDISAANLRNQANYAIKDANEGVSWFLGNIWTRVAGTFEKIKTFYTFTPKVEDAKDTEDWVARYKNIQSLQTDVGREVLEKYEWLMGQIGDEQLTKDIYEGKLARIYIELESGTKLLEPYRKVAQKICEQDQAANVDGEGCLPK